MNAYSAELVSDLYGVDGCLIRLQNRSTFIGRQIPLGSLFFAFARDLSFSEISMEKTIGSKCQVLTRAENSLKGIRSQYFRRLMLSYSRLTITMYRFEFMD